MSPSIQNALNALQQLRQSVANYANNDIPFNQQYGWNTPSVSGHDILKRIDDTSGQLTLWNTVSTLSQEQQLDADKTVSRVSFLINNVISNINSPNSIQVVPAIFDELDRLKAAFPVRIPPPPPVPDWQKLAEDGYIPSKIASKFKGFETRLANLVPKFDILETKLKRIDEAFEAADNLPENLSTLEAAQREASDSRTQAQSLASDAASHARDALEKLKEIENWQKMRIANIQT